MTKHNVVDLGRRREHRYARRTAEDALVRIYQTTRRALEANLLGSAFSSANDVAADGMPSGGSDGPSGSGDHGDPVLGAVMANELVRRTVLGAVADLERAESLVAGALRAFGNVAAQSVPPADADPPGAGHCQRCGRWVSGSDGDRIRSGMCEADYRAWKRAGSPDRVAWCRTSDDDQPSA